MRQFLKLVVIYIIAVAGYALLITRFTIPVHLGVDEELYISMARSFHYDGVFSQDGQILNYSCVLYSMLLSLAYYFYSPEHIMFVMRLIGILSMLSSIFPIYLLSKSIWGEQNATKVATFGCLLPSMMDTAYCMQEVLSYPLFLWLIYAVYLEIKNNRANDIQWSMLPITILSVLCYFTKTYMIFFPVAYCMFILINSFFEKTFAWKKIVLFLGSYFVLLLLCKQVIVHINNGIAGTNHYANQFSHLFPITGRTIISAVSCIIFYIIALMFYVGVLPLVLLPFNYKKYDGHECKLLLFIFGALVVLIVEIVVSIVLTEEGNVLVPHKFLWRYFQVFEVPLLLLFIQKYKDMEIPKWIWKVYVVVFGYLGLYYIYVGNRQSTSIIDAPVFLLMENINKYIIPYFNIMACLGSAFIVVFVYMLKRKNKIKSITGCFVRFSLISIILLVIINIFQLPYFTNVIANGTKIEEDALKIVNYWEEHIDSYDKIYYIKTGQDRYEGNVYAYFPVDVYKISENELDNIEEESLAILVKNNMLPAGMENINLSTEALWAIHYVRKDKNGNKSYGAE